MGMESMPQTWEEWFIAVLAVAALLTVLRQYLKSRRTRLPYSARNDVKARRLWQGDPAAYARKYEKIDLQLEARAREREQEKNDR